MSEDGPKERSDASRLAVMSAAGTLVLLVALALIAGRALVTAPPGRPEAPALGREGLFQAGPSSRPDIVAVREEMEREVHDRLETYGWVDRKGGVVRIPIERAMEIMAQRKS
jgi:hypothetical protein